MPGLERRREEDSRAGRFESEVRSSDASRPGFSSARKFMCSKCRRLYEENSKWCPRCETTTMGELKPIPAEYAESAMAIAMRRAWAKVGT